MSRTASTVTYGEFCDVASPEDLMSFWNAGSNLGAKRRPWREMVMGSNHTSIWNMVQDVERIRKEGGNRDATIRMTGKLTLEGVAAVLDRYVRRGEPYPTPEGEKKVDAGTSTPSGTTSGTTTSTGTSTSTGSGEPPQPVSDNILTALVGLYEDKSKTFGDIATANDFRMMLWGIAPEVLKTRAEQFLITEAIGTLTRSADAAATIKSILSNAGISDESILNAMRKTDSNLVSSQHAKAADNLFHLSHISRELNGYESFVRDEAVKIVRHARQRSEPSEDQVREARNEVALTTLGLLLDNLDREVTKWNEYHANRKAAADRASAAQNGGASIEASPVPYDTLTPIMKSRVTQEMWDVIPPSGQNTLVMRWMDSPEGKAEAAALAAAAQSDTSDTTPPAAADTSTSDTSTSDTSTTPETTTPPTSGGNGNRRRR